MLGGGAAFIQQQRRVVWATQQVVEVSRLVRSLELHAAFKLTEQVLPALPNDSTRRALRPVFTDFLKVVTVPPGARVSVRRLGETDTTWTVVGTTPMDSLPLPKLLHEMGYRMRIERENSRPSSVLAAVHRRARIGGGPPIDTMYLTGWADRRHGSIRGGSVSDGHGGQSSTLRITIGKREVANRESDLSTLAVIAIARLDGRCAAGKP